MITRKIILDVIQSKYVFFFFAINLIPSLILQRQVHFSVWSVSSFITVLQIISTILSNNILIKIGTYLWDFSENIYLHLKLVEIRMWLGIILSFLLYSRNGYVYGLTTQRSNGEVIETDIKKDVNVMKSSFHELLKRVINNENEISVLESQTQYLGSELENIRRHYSCQIDEIHENNLQIRDEFHKSRSQLVTATDSINETMQELSHTVDLLDKKYLLLENIARQKSEENLNKSVNESGTYILTIVW